MRMVRVPMQVDPEFRKTIRQLAAENDMSIAEFTRKFSELKQKRPGFFDRFKI